MVSNILPPPWKYPINPERAHFMYLNLQYLETLDKVVIPRDYPNVSSEAADRTTQGSLTFVDMCATLNIHPVQGWSVEPDKKLVKCEVGHARS